MTGEAQGTGNLAAGGECDSSNHAATVLALFHLLTKGKTQHEQKERIGALATRTECTKADADRSIGPLLEIIMESLKDGENLTLQGFGTFEVRSRAERAGRNPKTGEALKINASKGAGIQARGLCLGSGE